jgi:hypothetical protein
MPVQRRFDFQLAGKGFLLARGQFKGRAWDRTGRADTPGQRTQVDAKFGVLPDELDHPEVWDDWSGGFGHAYRRPDEPNTYHWSENFDARFPRQLVHCQAPRELAGEATYQVHDICVIPLQSAVDVTVPPGEMTVLGFGHNTIRSYLAKGIASIGTSTDYSGADLHFGSRAALTATWLFVPVTSATGFLLRTMEAMFSYSQTTLPGVAFSITGQQVWRAHRGNLVQAVNIGVSPASTSNWTATLAIGSDRTGINDVVELEDQLFSGKPDGLYAGDQSGSFANINPGITHHQEDYRDLAVFNGAVVGVVGDEICETMLTDYGAIITPIGPYAAKTNRSDVRGRFRTVTGLTRWLYSGLWTGSASYILAGTKQNNGYVWHTQQKLPSVAVNKLRFDGATQWVSAQGTIYDFPQRMWMTTDTALAGSSPLLFWPVPSFNDNPLLNDPVFSANYIGSARIDLGAVDWGAPGTPKVYRACEVWANNLASAAQWCDVYYTVDSGTRTKLGTVAKSPKDTLYFSAGEGSFVTGQSIELSLESFTASAGVTPVYRSLVLRGALQPRSVDTITAVVRIADNLADRQGHPMRSGATMLQELRDLGNPDQQGLQAHQLIDLAGATSYVKVLGRIGEQETYQQGEDSPEIAATVKLAVLDYGG